MDIRAHIYFVLKLTWPLLSKVPYEMSWQKNDE